ERHCRESELGVGMAYSPHWVDKNHLANITSLELPIIGEPTLYSWLLSQSDEWLKNEQLSRIELLDNNAEKKLICRRVLLGKYFNFCFQKILKTAIQLGISTVPE